MSQRPICACGCGEFIPEERIKHEGLKRVPKFCNKDHMRKWRAENGFYRMFSKKGLEKQQEMAVVQGERPGNNKRRAVLDRVRNKLGRKTGKHNMGKATYYGISALESKRVYDGQGRERIVADWFMLSGPCDNREQAEDQGKEKVDTMYPRVDSAERSTLLKNLVVVPKSRLREYRIKTE